MQRLTEPPYRQHTGKATSNSNHWMIGASVAGRREHTLLQNLVAHMAGTEGGAREVNLT